jgi:4-amino-4-deoxy-L-arabinose transferase-like glycosyltransferase
MKPTARFTYPLVVFCAALACRLLYYLCFAVRCPYGYALDSRFYVEQAQYLLAHHSFLSYSAGPLYPLFLAVSFRVFGVSLPLVSLLQMVLMSLAAVLFFVFARRYFGNREYALAAGLFVAADPLLVYFSPYVLTENLFLFMLAAFFALLAAAWQNERQGYGLSAGAGVALGFAVLCRSTVTSFFPFLLLAGYCRGRWNGLQKAGLVLIVALLTLLPWEVLLCRHAGKFVFMQVKSGSQLYQSLLPYGITAQQQIRWHSEICADAEVQRVLSTNDELFIDAYFKDRALTWIKDHRKTFALRTFQKAADYWRPFPNYPYSSRMALPIGLYVSAVYLLAVIGLVRVRSPLRLTAVLFIVSAFLPFIIFFPQIRYRLPVHVMLLLLAAGGFMSIVHGSKNKTAD